MMATAELLVTLQHACLFAQAVTETVRSQWIDHRMDDLVERVRCGLDRIRTARAERRIPAP